MDRFNDIMVDIETLSTEQDASIVSIAAVQFDRFKGSTGRIFYESVKPSEWGLNARRIDGNTLIWWFKQGKELTDKTISECTEHGYKLKDVLSDFVNFYNECSSDSNDDDMPVVWGNGSIMDISIIQNALNYFNMDIPWKYWNVNDVRTIVRLNPEIKENTVFEGEKHNPVDDCKHQIKYLVNTLNTIKIEKSLKYELTNSILEYKGHVLHRVKALKDFSDVKKGELGGWVESIDNLSQEGDCWLYENSKAYGNSRVYGNAKLFLLSEIFDNAKAYGNSTMCVDSSVYGNSEIYGDCIIAGNAKIFGNAKISGDVMIHYDAEIGGDSVYSSSENIGTNIPSLLCNGGIFDDNDF